MLVEGCTSSRIRSCSLWQSQGRLLEPSYATPCGESIAIMTHHAKFITDCRYSRSSRVVGRAKAVRGLTVAVFALAEGGPTGQSAVAEGMS